MNKLNNVMKRLTVGKYIQKCHKTEVKEIQNELDNNRYDDLNILLQTITTSKIYSAKLNKQINDLTIILTNEVIECDNAIDIVEEILVEIGIDNNELEKQLDSKCVRYMKFTTSNPAEHIKYDKTDKLYIYSDKKKIKRKFLKNLVPLVQEKLRDDFGKSFGKIVPWKKIEYKNKKIIIYQSENEGYFDINHVINLFDSIAERKKYDEYKKDIKICDFRDNDVGGFYIKQYIDKETFFKMILHTNSVFSNGFKDEVAKILDKLTDTGQLTISNDSLIIENSIKIVNKDHFHEEYNYTQTYDNTYLVNFIKNEIIKCKSIDWIKYCDQHIHVMYCFIMTLDDPTGNNRILCKIGYSADLVTRFKSLEREYKCKFYLLGLKTVHSQHDEKMFHTLLKLQYPELSVNIKINNHDKDELYVFDVKLYNTFLKFDDRVLLSDNVVNISHDTMIMMNNYFEHLDEMFELELVKKLHQIIKLTDIINEHQCKVATELNKSYYDYIMVKENNRHIEALQDKVIELKKLELEMQKLII
jgi:hypothetical protein